MDFNLISLTNKNFNYFYRNKPATIQELSDSYHVGILRVSSSRFSRDP